MLRLRDHLLSLAAVFLALGLGILVGSGMSDDVVLRQQRLVIDQMSEEFKTLRAEKQQLEADMELLTRELSFWEQYHGALFPSLAAGSLSGRTVAVVSQGAQVPEALLTMLSDSGAVLSPLVQIAAGEEPGRADGELLPPVAALLLGNAGDEELSALSRLEQEERLRLEKWDGQAADTVIFYLGSRPRAGAAFIKKLAARLSADGLELVALESRDVSDSLLGDLKELGVSTIDHADTVFGQVSLLGVLLGRPGHYGTKAAAEQFIATF